jgi:hypothetical protein
VSDAPKYKKRSGWKDSGRYWSNDKGRYGMRYQCKTCGLEKLGMGGEMQMHFRTCPHWIEAEARERIYRFHACAESLRTLGRNLAVAGALCEAIKIGDENARVLYWHGRRLWLPNLEGKAWRAELETGGEG